MGWFHQKKSLNIDGFMKLAAKWDPIEVRGYEPLYHYLYDHQQKVTYRKFGLRLIVVSDTHGTLAFDKNRFPAFLDTVEGFDLCILLGDMHPLEMPIILDCIPTEKIIAIKGNHDAVDLFSRFGIRELSGTCYEYQGVRFVGLDGSFRYKNEDFPSHSQYESLKIARGLPEADVLLTHDVMLCDFQREPAHAGLIGTAYYIYQQAVPWHFHGHIHKSYQKQYSNGTTEKSVYLCEYMEI